MTLIIGNVIALVASILMVYAGIIKEKKKILYVQSTQIGLFVISNIILNGISGAVINVINFIRNILCYKDKLGNQEKIILTILSVALTLWLNNLGFIGLLPLISAIIYLWFMTTKNVIKFKLLIAVTIALWGIYDFIIQSYTSFVFDVLSIMTNIISIGKIKLTQK